MPFIVQAPSKGSATTPFHAEKKTRADAIRAAVALVAKGVADVTITDEDGKTYSPANFRAFFTSDSVKAANGSLNKWQLLERKRRSKFPTT